MRNITKEFPGIIANDDVTLQLKKGEIHALLGENGAGKSTLMSVLFGLYRQEAGAIYKNGEAVQIQGPNDANRLGIGMVHQHFKLVHNFTVLENIVLGVETTKSGVLQIKEAREKGDLKENAEYDTAKEEQAKYEARIVELEKMLRSAVIIDEDELDKDIISIGSKVTLYNEDFDEDEEYIIVGSAEANPAGGKISNESPLGSVIIGKRVGDDVVVDAPAGTIKYKVKEIA